jgi:hypothetical protein
LRDGIVANPLKTRVLSNRKEALVENSVESRAGKGSASPGLVSRFVRDPRPGPAQPEPDPRPGPYHEISRVRVRTRTLLLSWSDSRNTTATTPFQTSFRGSLLRRRRGGAVEGPFEKAAARALLSGLASGPFESSLETGVKGSLLRRQRGGVVEVPFEGTVSRALSSGTFRRPF